MFFQAEDGIRDRSVSRGLGDVYKRQPRVYFIDIWALGKNCLLYTSDAADELDGVDLGGRRIIKKHNF
ncbi:hypothetical protein JMUB7556_28370 [Staphylococcus aureus]